MYTYQPRVGVAGRNPLGDLWAPRGAPNPRRNAFRQGFYWPTVVADAIKIVRSCRGCQFYVKQTHKSAQALQMIPITWPFVVWGLDLVGAL
jgi:hypothetical protein